MRATFIGLTTLDVIYLVHRLPRSNEKIRAVKQLISAGGPASNAAVAFAALGGKSILLSCLGDSPLAKSALHDLSKYGVETIDVADDANSEITIASILVEQSNGKRTVISTKGTERSCLPLSDSHFQQLCSGSVILWDGYYPEIAIPALRKAKTAGLITVLDGGSWKPWLAEALPMIDIAICSQDFRTPGANCSRDVLIALLRGGAGFACVTRGAQPILWKCPTADGVVPVMQLDVKDTLGAGDFLHGAFCYEIKSTAVAAITTALEAAARIASMSTTSFGSREWLRELNSR